MAGALGYLAVFGQWQSAMVTLSAIAIAVPLGVAGGLAARHRGLAAARRGARRSAPMLDAMQTVPVFAYLLPILILFGFGPVAALIATIVYAMPPMVRVTLLALRGVPEEIVEFGRMAGATPRQLVWRVMLPAARAPLMVGVNQVIMLSLNMVIIASMIGAGGLGYDVLTALRRLDIGAGVEAGVAIVVLAVALDRLSQAYALRAAAAAGRRRLARPAAAGGAGRGAGAVAGRARGPGGGGLSRSGWRSRPARFWAEAIRWLNVTFFDTFEAIKTAVLTHLLLPVRRLAGGDPLVVGDARGRLSRCCGSAGRGGRRSPRGSACSSPSPATGSRRWCRSTCAASRCVIAAAIGLPVGVAAGLNPRLWRAVQAVIDTLQTLPSFVYLIPVVMLFRVGEFTAMIAIVLYAVAPAIRYAALGVREVDPALIEATTAMGATPRPARAAGAAAAGGARDPAGAEPDDPARDLDAGDHRAGRHARPRAGGLRRADQGRRRPGPRRRRLHRDDRDDRRPHDDAGRAAAAPAAGARAVTAALDAAARRAAALPIWSGPVEPRPLAGGITNLNFVVEDAGRRFLVRIGGDIPEHNIVRTRRARREPRRACRRARRRRCATPSRARWCSTSSRPARFTAEDVRDPANLDRLVGAGPALSPRDPAAFPRAGADVLGVPGAARLRPPAARRAAARIAATCRCCSPPPPGSRPPSGRSQIVFGHNDLLPANILDDGARLWLVDWEYAGFNGPLFDLGGLASNAGMDADAARGAAGGATSGARPDAGLRRRFAAMTAASLLRETMWSMVSELHSSLAFDYAAYTAENRARFEAAWSAFLELERP